MRRREIQVKVRLDPVEYQKLQSDVRRSGLTQSAYLRQLLQGAQMREPPSRDYYRILTELNRIGNNLNQIVRVANSHPEALPDVQALRRIFDLLSCRLQDWRV